MSFKGFLFYEVNELRCREVPHYIWLFIIPQYSVTRAFIAMPDVLLYFAKVYNNNVICSCNYLKTTFCNSENVFYSILKERILIITLFTLTSLSLFNILRTKSQFTCKYWEQTLQPIPKLLLKPFLNLEGVSIGLLSPGQSTRLSVINCDYSNCQNV